MEIIKKYILFIATLLVLSSASFAANEQVRVQFNEFVTQEIRYDPLTTGSSGKWFGANENQTIYSLNGNIVVSNQNPNLKTISDIYVLIENSEDISLPTNSDGRTGSWISNNVSSGSILLHIPELLTGENSTWVYTINDTNVIPPVDLAVSYSGSKILAGDPFTVVDTLTNNFNNASFQQTCIYDINLTQTLVPVNFSGTYFDFNFVPGSIAGSDSGNVTYSPDNQTQSWDVLGGGCLNKAVSTDVNYSIISPLNVPSSKQYDFSNTRLEYSLNESISHLRVKEIKAVSEAEVTFDKATLPIINNNSIVWNVTGRLTTVADITYNLTSLTLWVSQRNVNGSFTDPNTVDVDTEDATPLKVNYFPNVLVNSTQFWTNPDWNFNYTDVPSPIVWMDVNFSIHDDGAQLIDRSVSKAGNDIYIKELYLIIGYWLEIEKNITSIGTDQYRIKIDVHNKGNQVTPAGAIVTIYDFVPSEFNIIAGPTFQTSPWYTTASSNNSVSGDYNGTLHQWALTPNTSLGTSFAAGSAKNENTTWSATFDVQGTGDYTLLDVFITGLDPQKVDGAGGTKSVVVSEVLDRIKSVEGIFAVVASVLLLLGLLL